MWSRLTATEELQEVECGERGRMLLVRNLQPLVRINTRRRARRIAVKREPFPSTPDLALTAATQVKERWMASTAPPAQGENEVEKMRLLYQGRSGMFLRSAGAM